MFLMTFLYSLTNVSLGIVLLELLFMALLVPYIFHYYYLENNEQILQKLIEILRKDDVVLVKASNGMKFYNIIDYLRFTVAHPSISL